MLYCPLSVVKKFITLYFVGARTEVHILQADLDDNHWEFCNKQQQQLLQKLQLTLNISF